MARSSCLFANNVGSEPLISAAPPPGGGLEGLLADLEHWHHDVFRVRWHDRAYEWADTLASNQKPATKNYCRRI